LRPPSRDVIPKLMRPAVAGHIVAAIIKKVWQSGSMGPWGSLLAQRLVGGMQAHRQGEPDLRPKARRWHRPAQFRKSGPPRPRAHGDLRWRPPPATHRLPARRQHMIRTLQAPELRCYREGLRGPLPIATTKNRIDCRSQRTIPLQPITQHHKHPPTPTTPKTPTSRMAPNPPCVDSISMNKPAATTSFAGPSFTETPTPHGGYAGKNEHPHQRPPHLARRRQTVRRSLAGNDTNRSLRGCSRPIDGREEADPACGANPTWPTHAFRSSSTNGTEIRTSSDRFPCA